FVESQDQPVKGACTDFRLDVFENEANAKDEFILETVAFFDTIEEAESFSGLPPTDDTDANEPYQPYYDISGKWLAEEFTSPSPVYRARKLLYHFTGNYGFTLSALEYMGYGGVLTNVPFNSEYLKNPDDFALLKEAFDEAADKGMELWIYDEYPWPSGKAFGYVLDSNAEFEATGVEMLRVTGRGNISYTLPSDYMEIIGASLDTDNGVTPIEAGERSISRSNENEYTLYVYARRHTYPLDQSEDRSNFFTLRNVDLLNPDAVAKFLEITYDSYYNALGGTFNSVAAFFTDEPNLGNRDYDNYVVWTDALPEVFLEMHGYNITEHMHSLFAGQTELDHTVRIDFYQTVSEMFSRAYTRQVTQWCDEHGVSSSGHLLFEESLTRHIETYGGDLMGIVGEMAIPGVDILHVEAENLLNSNTDVGSVIGIKYGASAVKNTGKTDLMIEFTPLANTSADFLDNPQRYAIEGATISTFCGANTFCVICPDSSFTVPALQSFNNYIGRINAALDNSTTVTPIALFVPTDSARAEHLVSPANEKAIDQSLKNCAVTLLKNGLDFTFIDSASIDESTLYNGKLQIGLGEYSVIVLPQTTVMSLQTANKLRDFQAAGGKIIWIGTKPTISGNPGESEEISSIVSELGEFYPTFNYDCITVLKETASPEILLSGAANNIWISRYTRLDCEKEIYYLANMAKTSAQISVVFPDGGNFDIYVPIDGNVISASGQADIEIESYQGVLVVRSK
ncbi:MAG: hypothetical protein IKZ19_07470, partial [Clostridia bacterium]|nr:hypothetical protein [Clostridia bacterium]